METTGATRRPDTSGLKYKGFKIHEVSGDERPSQPHARRDYYKIVLVTAGNTLITYGDNTVAMKGAYLFFSNPRVAHRVEDLEKGRRGYACLFSEDFINSREGKNALRDSPLTRVEDSPVIALNDAQASFMKGLFVKMLEVYRDGFPACMPLVKTCIELILQDASRIQPPQQLTGRQYGTSRISAMFLELLAKQFPVEHPGEPLLLRSAHDYAKALSVHVNYLNRSVKSSTGKSTSAHISGRIISEAKALLRHTNWNVADIAYSLGFEYPTYFNNYFKKATGQTPHVFRKQKV